MSILKRPQKYVLTAAQKEMYRSEKLTNFRWVAKIMAKYSPYTLSARDLADEKLFSELAEIGTPTILHVHSFDIQLFVNQVNLPSLHTLMRFQWIFCSRI